MRLSYWDSPFTVEVRDFKLYKYEDFMAGKKLIESLQEFDDIVDGLLAPVKDYTDTVSDLNAPIKAMKTIYQIRKKYQLKSFIKGYYIGIGEQKTDEEARTKLRNLFADDQNILTVSEIIESALSALSVKCSSMLGVVAGRLLTTDSKIVDNMTYVIVSSLRQLTDKDLEVFDQLYSSIEKGVIKGRKSGHYTEYRMRDVFKEVNKETLPFERELVELVIEKLKNYGILSYSVGGIGSYGNARGAFIVTEYSDELVKLYRDV